MKKKLLYVLLCFYQECCFCMESATFFSTVGSNYVTGHIFELAHDKKKVKNLLFFYGYAMPALEDSFPGINHRIKKNQIVYRTPDDEVVFKQSKPRDRFIDDIEYDMYVIQKGLGLSAKTQFLSEKLMFENAKKKAGGALTNRYFRRDVVRGVAIQRSEKIFALQAQIRALAQPISKDSGRGDMLPTFLKVHIASFLIDDLVGFYSYYEAMENYIRPGKYKAFYNKLKNSRQVKNTCCCTIF